MMKMMILKMKKINEVGTKVTVTYLSTGHPPPTKFMLEILLQVLNFGCLSSNFTEVHWKLRRNKNYINIRNTAITRLSERRRTCNSHKSCQKIMAEQTRWAMIFLAEKREDDDNINIWKKGHGWQFLDEEPLPQKQLFAQVTMCRIKTR